MNNKLTMYFVGLLTFVGLGSPTANAALLFRFDTSAPVIGNVAQFNIGQSHSVNLFLDGTGGDAAFLETNGLLTANLGNDLFNPSGVTLTGVGSIAASTPNVAFNDVSTEGFVSLDNRMASWTAAVDFTSPAVFGAASTQGYSIFLGSFTITPGNAFGNSGVLTITPTAMGDFTFGNGSSIAGLTGSFEFTAVPEPSTMAVLSLIGGFAAYRVRRRSKTTAVASV